jgi:flagellar biosynthesis protein FliQ
LTASLGIKFLRTIDKKDLFPEKYVSCISILALGASTMFYIINPNLIHAIITALLFGFFMGINTLSSQTLRRKLIPAKIFPNFMSIELLIAMSTEWLVAKICVFAGNKYGLTSVTALKFALPFYVLLALTYLTIKTPKNAVNT